MTAADIETASELERSAHDDGLPPTAFESEVLQNPVARYVVVETADGTLAGFAGLWLQLDEAHVVNVLVAPALRGRRYGRPLLHALLDLAMHYGMTVATLEVRPENGVARALYRAYGFYEVGDRPRYYRDGGDALIMTTEELTSPAYQRRFAGLADALKERLGMDEVTINTGDVADLAG